MVYRWDPDRPPLSGKKRKNSTTHHTASRSICTQRTPQPRSHQSLHARITKTRSRGKSRGPSPAWPGEEVCQVRYVMVCLVWTSFVSDARRTYARTDRRGGRGPFFSPIPGQHVWILHRGYRSEYVRRTDRQKGRQTDIASKQATPQEEHKEEADEEPTQTEQEALTHSLTHSPRRGGEGTRNCRHERSWVRIPVHPIPSYSHDARCWAWSGLVFQNVGCGCGISSVWMRRGSSDSGERISRPSYYYPFRKVGWDT